MTTALRALERTAVKPILFSGPMVRALIEGRKTQTRRVLKDQPKFQADGCHNAGLGGRGNWHDFWNVDGKNQRVRIPYAPGDLLWVRETSIPDFPKEFSYYDWSWAEVPTEYRSPQHVLFKASWTGHELTWHPSIHMPRWASRLTLEVTAVKVERLQEISEEDADAEGMQRPFVTIDGQDWPVFESPVNAFARLWDSLNAKRGYGWEANPWVGVYSFRVHRVNVDDLLRNREAA